MDLLTFRIAGHEGALPQERVEAISPMLAFTPRPEWLTILIGESRWKGKVLPGVDLSPVLGILGHRFDTLARVIICEEEERRVGILVDLVSGLETRAPDEPVATLARLVHEKSSRPFLLDLQDVFRVLRIVQEDQR